MAMHNHRKTIAVTFSMLFACTAIAADAPAAKEQVKAGTFCKMQDSKACQDAVTPQQTSAGTQWAFHY